MTCDLVQLPDGTRAIVCSSRKAKRCILCGARASRECDWKVPQRSSGTCDRPICANCAVSPAPEKDLCPDHAAEWHRRLTARATQPKSAE